MYRKWFGIAVSVAALVLPLILFSCAADQRLESIEVVPSGATFGSVGAQIQFKAIGTYSHPAGTKDLSDQVQWSIDSQNLATVTNTGFVTSTSICGSGNLMASVTTHSHYVFGTAFLTGSGIGTPACGEALLSVDIKGNGSVSSSPSGIDCPGSCSAVFTLDSSVGLTAAPDTGHTFAGWRGCDSPSGNTCTMTLDTNKSVSATFN